MAVAAAASALLNAHLGYDLIRTYARLQTGGNISAFLALMLTFGQGAAPSRVLMKLRTEKDVIVECRRVKLRVMAHSYSCCAFAVVVVVSAYP